MRDMEDCPKSGALARQKCIGSRSSSSGSGVYKGRFLSVVPGSRPQQLTITLESDSLVAEISRIDQPLESAICSEFTAMVSGNTEIPVDHLTFEATSFQQGN